MKPSVHRGLVSFLLAPILNLFHLTSVVSRNTCHLFSLLAHVVTILATLSVLEQGLVVKSYQSGKRENGDFVAVVGAPGLFK